MGACSKYAKNQFKIIGSAILYGSNCHDIKFRNKRPSSSVGNSKLQHLERKMMILVVIVCILLYAISTRRQRKYRLPPGPWSIPIVGNFQWLQKFPWIYLSKLRKTYGPIATIKLGRAQVFILNDIETWKEAFRREEFSRQPGKIFEAVLKNKSIVFGDGNPEIKRYMMRVLNDFGINSSEDLILQEVSSLLEKLADSNEKPMRVQTLFTIPTVNVLLTLLLGNRIAEEDQVMHQLTHMIATVSKDSSIFGRSILSLIPYISKIIPSSSRSEFIRDLLIKMTNVFKILIQHHVKTREKSSVRDITDVYMDKVEHTDPTSDSFFAGGDSLQYVYTGLFSAASDSTSTSLEWLIMFIASKPVVQRCLQIEIDAVIGNRKPSLADRDQMPYTLAIIQEMFRLSTIDIAQFHQAKIDTKLLGYDIPKGSILLPNVYGISHDPDIWADPYDFSPERFLDANGKFMKSDKFIAFGLGRRSCPGEILARNQIFLFATSMFQQFNLEIDGKCPPLFGVFGIFHHPDNFNVVFGRRNNNNVIP